MSASSGVPEIGAAGTKGLRTGALGYLANVVIGVASTAPAYSLAVSLGLVAGAVGLMSPAIMWVAFIPMLCIAIAYYYMNRADPDCGTSFTWVTKAMGPHLGWLTGWAIIVADIVVMASLAEVAAQYTYSLFGIDPFESPIVPIMVGAQTIDVGVIGLGVLFIAALTWLCYVGIEVSARIQTALLSIELVMLALFAVVALARVYGGGIDGAITPSLDWLNPFSIVTETGEWDSGALAAGLLIALFIYWGWDTTATVNEESANPTEQPGRATIAATIILVATYVLVTIAAQALHGAEFLAEQGEGDVFAALAAEVLGSPLSQLLIIAILTSAAASTQTTILPTARTALSMGARGALPKMWANVHPQFQTPTNATLWMGILSVVWYVALKLVSENVYWDAIAALGLMIAFYYGLTGYACAIYYRHVLLRSVKNFVLMGILPVLGGVILTWAFVRSVIDMADPANSYTGETWFGVGVPLALSIGFAIVGVVLMVAWWWRAPAFFRNHTESYDAPSETPKPTPRIRPIGSD